MTAALHRAEQLLQQQRYDLAEQTLRGYIAEEPDNPYGYALLALALHHQEQQNEAEQAAAQAVGLGPDWAFTHYVQALLFHHADKTKAAVQAIEEALRLDREEASYFRLKGAIHLQQRDWTAALEAAEAALRLNADDVEANNLRAMALVQLGRREEAGQTIGAALARDPNHANSHANMGWKCLHDNRPREAAEHFREALRLEPDNNWARRGILEALKARNVVYRLLLKYFLWMSTLSRTVQWGVIIGLVVIANVVPGLLWVYLPLVILTWVAQPLFNLMLRLDPFGRYVLDKDEIRAANVIGVCAALCVGGIVVGLVTGHVAAFLAAMAALGLMLPVAGTFAKETLWKRLALGVYTLVLAGMAVAWVYGATLEPTPEWVAPVARNLILGWVAFTWIASFMGE